MWLTWVLLTIWAIVLIGGVALGFAIGDDLVDKLMSAFMVTIFTGFAGGFVLGLPAVAWASSHYNKHDAVCTVESKDRTSDDMRIYTKECGVFVNGDDWFNGKTNSADVWNRIKVGETYTFTVVGWRNTITSSFPNVLDVKPAS